jgi:hypothetical protein
VTDETRDALLMAVAEAVVAYRLSVELGERGLLSARLANIQSLIYQAKHERAHPPEAR